jgi:hypothetical protein
VHSWAAIRRKPYQPILAWGARGRKFESCRPDQYLRSVRKGLCKRRPVRVTRDATDKVSPGRGYRGDPIRFYSLLFALARRLQRWRLTLHPLAEILSNLREFRGARSPVIFVARSIQSQCRGRGYKRRCYLRDGIFTQFFAPAFRATHRKLNCRFSHGCDSLLSCDNGSPPFQTPVSTYSGNSTSERNLRARQKKTRALPEKWTVSECPNRSKDGGASEPAAVAGTHWRSTR